MATPTNTDNASHGRQPSFLQKLSGRIKQAKEEVKTTQAALGDVMREGLTRAAGIDQSEGMRLYRNQLNTLAIHIVPIREIVVRYDVMGTASIKEKLQPFRETLVEYANFRAQTPNVNPNALQKQLDQMKLLLEKLSAQLNSFQLQQALEEAARAEASQMQASSSAPAASDLSFESGTTQMPAFGMRASSNSPPQEPLLATRTQNYGAVQADLELSDNFKKRNGFPGQASSSRGRTAYFPGGFRQPFPEPEADWPDSGAHQSPIYVDPELLNRLRATASDPDHHASRDDYGEPSLYMPTPKHKRYNPPEHSESLPPPHSAPPSGEKHRIDGRSTTFGDYDVTDPFAAPYSNLSRVRTQPAPSSHPAWDTGPRANTRWDSVSPPDIGTHTVHSSPELNRSPKDYDGVSPSTPTPPLPSTWPPVDKHRPEAGRESRENYDEMDPFTAPLLHSSLAGTRRPPPSISISTKNMPPAFEDRADSPNEVSSPWHRVPQNPVLKVVTGYMADSDRRASQTHAMPQTRQADSANSMAHNTNSAHHTSVRTGEPESPTARLMRRRLQKARADALEDEAEMNHADPTLTVPNRARVRNAAGSEDHLSFI